MSFQVLPLSPNGEEEGDTSRLHDSGGSGYRVFVFRDEGNARSLIEGSDPGPE